MLNLSLPSSLSLFLLSHKLRESTLSKHELLFTSFIHLKKKYIYTLSKDQRFLSPLNSPGIRMSKRVPVGSTRIRHLWNNFPLKLHTHTNTYTFSTLMNLSLLKPSSIKTNLTYSMILTRAEFHNEAKLTSSHVTNILPRGTTNPTFSGKTIAIRDQN